MFSFLKYYDIILLKGDLKMMAKFSDRLREALNLREMTQAELSRKTGISKGSISDYLSGNYEAKQDKIYDIARALNVDEGWLMGFDNDIERVNHKPSKNSDIIAAHIDDDVTDEEMKEILNFIDYIKQKE